MMQCQIVRRITSALVFLAAFLPGFAAAQGVEKPNIKVMMDWVIQGTHAPFILADIKGYFKQEGLTVTIDRGTGAGNTANAVGSGGYDFGWVDTPTLVKFNAQNPKTPQLGVYMSFDESALAIVSLKARPINKPSDIDGKRIAAPSGSAVVNTLPILLRAGKSETAKVNWQFVAPQLMPTLLVKGDTDGIGGFTNSQIMAVRSLGVKMEDITVLKYADFGVDMYGLALTGMTNFVNENPRTVAAFVRALNKGTKDAIADPKAAVALMKTRDPLMDEALEVERLQISLNHTLTAHTAKAGLSSVTRERLQRTIDTVASSETLLTKPTIADIWTDQFLPSVADRMPPALGK